LKDVIHYIFKLTILIKSTAQISKKNILEKSYLKKEWEHPILDFIHNILVLPQKMETIGAKARKL
jgi:SNF2 family DNA or RNA helicase